MTEDYVDSAVGFKHILAFLTNQEINMLDYKGEYIYSLLLHLLLKIF